MKRLLSTILIVWILFASIVTTQFYTDLGSRQNNEIAVIINRLHNRITQDFKLNIKIDDMSYLNNVVRSDPRIIGIKIFDMNESSTVILEETPSVSNDYIYKSIMNSDYMMRVEFKDNSKNKKDYAYRFNTLLIGSTIFMLLIMLVVVYNVILPILRLSEIPKEIARGLLSRSVKQSQLGYFKEFIWGLDVLREVIRDEKLKNIELEKDRKTLVASLSHDIKTPLNAIKNYSIALREGIYEDDKKKDEALDIIIDKTNVIESLTNELLSNSRGLNAKIKIKPQILYVHDLVDSMADFIRESIDLKGIAFELDNDISNTQVWVDSDRLLEVVSNLIENAIKYGDQELIKLEIHREASHIIFSIFNSGRGVSEKELKYIYTSFYRGSNVIDEKGHGLGLYISKKIMKGMEGDIYAENTGDGFSVSLVLKVSQ